LENKNTHMIKKLLFSAILLLLATATNAQRLDFKWTSSVRFENKSAGVFNMVCGSNSNYTYILNKSYGDYESSADYYLHAIRNNNGKLHTSTTLRNKKVIAAKDMVLRGVFVQQEVVYVFWTKDSKTQLEVHVQSLDLNLKEIGKLKKLQQYQKLNERKTREPEFFMLTNAKQNGNILFGAELAGKEGESIKVEAKVLKPDLSFFGLVKVEIPIMVNPKTSGLTSDYIFGDDGNLHIKTRIKEDKGKKITDYFDLYTYANLEDGRTFHYPFKFEGKQIFDFKIIEKEGKVSFVGMFMNIDPMKRVKSAKLNGLFQANLDVENKTLANVNFEQFDIDFLRELYKSDVKDLQTSKKTGTLDEIDSDYEIEDYRISEDGEVTIFTTIKDNYSVTICPPRGACYTNYYCRKKNVTVFRFDNEGKLIWGKNIDRDIEYSGWNIADVKVKEDAENYYIVYGATPNVKKFFAPEKAKQFKRNDVMEYAIMNKNTGSVKPYLYEINRPGAPKSENKSFAARDVSLLNNEMYAINNEVGRSGGGKVVRCMTVVCFPIGFLTNFGDFGKFIYTDLRLGVAEIR